MQCGSVTLPTFIDIAWLNGYVQMPQVHKTFYGTSTQCGCKSDHAVFVCEYS